MSDTSIPATIRTWSQNQLWGEHHLRWHIERIWDRLSPGARAQFSLQGWSRANRQEGVAGNGIDFLMMHRAMLKILRSQFPGDSSWFIGWLAPPTDPDDPIDPVPASTLPRTFSTSMQQAIQRLTSDLNSFASEDELGLYIETRFRPVPGDPANQSPDMTSGIHNYMHGRFADSASAIDMGDPSVNLENARFWRLHGWIDQVWTNYRQLKGLSDTDAIYVARLNEEVQAMSAGGHHHHPMANLRTAFASANSRLRLASLPHEGRQPFKETMAMQVQHLLDSTPVIENRNQLIEYLQVAIQIEHATLPLYLTAMWSLKVGGPHYNTLNQIVFQEMGHLGIVCNLLNAIDAEPYLVPPDATLPVFPGPLPGLDLSDTVIGDIALEPFSMFGGDKKSRMKLFMRIEEPATPMETVTASVPTVPKFHTIGEFYDVIIDGVARLSAAGELQFPLSRQDPNWQLVELSDMQIIKNSQDALDQLKLIKEQGEGASSTGGTGNPDQAHYYLFKQIVDEHEFDWSSGSPQPGTPLPFPNPEDVYQFSQAPLDDPDAIAFDETYSRMLDALHDAWHGNPAAIADAVGLMNGMSTQAISLMRDKQLGPNFRYVPPRARSMPLRVPLVRFAAMTKGVAPTRAHAFAAATTPGYSRVREILDIAVNGDSFGAHGAFWRSLSRDQFIVKVVRGQPLIARRSDGTFDPDESNLIKALEGRAPFGLNNVPPTPGAFLNRMPDGYPPLAQALIDEIRTWIGAGCPELAPAAVKVIDGTSAASATVSDYVLFWRNFDNVAAFQATAQVNEDIDIFFSAIQAWFDFAHDASKEAVWNTAINDANLVPRILRLESLQRQAVTQVLGLPTSLADMLMCWELFGDNTLPDDPLRPSALRHTMNGTVMWFIWAGFADAAVRLSATNSEIASDFWYAMSRAILIGLLNDGLFRGRFPITGFSPTSQGKVGIRTWVAALSDAQLSLELRTRLVEAGF